MSEPKIVSLAEARELGLKRYFTGEVCSRGHVSERYTRDRQCAACKKEKYDEYREKNPEKERARCLAYNARNLKKVRESTANWVKNNPHKKLHLNTLRYARKMKQTPPWLSADHKREILDFYNLSQKLSRETGVRHHVDHIIPLKGKFVSGLHVPWNLQVIPATQNIKKGNKVHD